MLWVVTDPAEGMRRIEALLERAPDAPSGLRGAAFLALGSCANPAGDDDRAEAAYEQGLAAFREVGDEPMVAQLLFRLGNSAFYRGDLDRAAVLADESLELNRGVGNAAEAQSVSLVGEVAYARGDRERGRELIAEGARLSEEYGFDWWRSRMLRKLADCLLEEGRPEEAEPAAREALELLVTTGDPHATVFALARVARVAAELGRTEQAGRHLGRDRGRGGAAVARRLGKGARPARRADPGARGRGLRARSQARAEPRARAGRRRRPRPGGLNRRRNGHGVEMAPRRPCDPFFSDDVTIGALDLRVYRCDWGWYVKPSDGEGVRSRYLDEALEGVLGRPLDRPALRTLVEMLDRELTAERDRAGHTVSRTVDRATI